MSLRVRIKISMQNEINIWLLHAHVIPVLIFLICHHQVQKSWKETTELQRIVRVLSREGDVEAEVHARKPALEYT